MGLGGKVNVTWQPDQEPSQRDPIKAYKHDNVIARHDNILAEHGKTLRDLQHMTAYLVASNHTPCKYVSC